MTSDAYYQPDLAWGHHVAYSRYVEQTCAGIVHLLHDGGVSPGASVDVGCGSGLLARELMSVGLVMHGVPKPAISVQSTRRWRTTGRSSHASRDAASIGHSSCCFVIVHKA